MDVIEKQLEYLNETMKETSSEGNAFLLKYYFGGLIAVLALLNIDLVLVKPGSFSGDSDYGLLAVAIVSLVVLSAVYFTVVLKRYEKFLQSHRKLKYKYELTLHQLLCQGNHEYYQYYLEQNLNRTAEKDDAIETPDNKKYDFEYIATYLLKHHRIRFKKFDEHNDRNTYLGMAMSVIALTLIVRGIFLLLDAQG